MKTYDFFGNKFSVKKLFERHNPSRKWLVTALGSGKSFEVAVTAEIKNYERAAFYVFLYENWKINGFELPKISR